MALDNLISISFTPDERQQMGDALTVIENIINPKAVNLTPEQRQRYGKLGNETENFASKTITYTEQKPEIIPVFVDQVEMKKDTDARKVIDPLLKRLNIVTEKLEDTYKLLGFDVYNSVMAIYRNVRYMSKQNVPGINVVYDDLKQQFPYHGPAPEPPVDGGNPPA